jgi:hypothetical protein
LKFSRSAEGNKTLNNRVAFGSTWDDLAGEDPNSKLPVTTWAELKNRWTDKSSSWSKLGADGKLTLFSELFN